MKFENVEVLVDGRRAHATVLEYKLDGLPRGNDPVVEWGQEVSVPFSVRCWGYGGFLVRIGGSRLSRRRKRLLLRVQEQIFAQFTGAQVTP